MKILELKDIIHIYNGKRVLNIPSLCIEKGKTYGVVGPNGSGKTTLLSIMSLILKPTQGVVYFKGHPVNCADAYLTHRERFLTMVLQNPYLFNMSVGKNVSYGLRARGISKRECEARLREALDMVGLTGFEKRRARELSGGETQLVALARALALNPQVLFLDEPTANVDVHYVERFERIILQINKEQGSTIVMSTHNLSQAYRMTETVFTLFEGSLVCSAMHNLFPGRVCLTDKGPCFDTGEITIWISDNTRCPKSTHVTINPEDIIVSKEPFSSSARNIFKGMISNITDHGGKVMLEVRSKENFRVFITPVSLHEMGLTVGSHVYLTFKANSVHLL